MKKLMCCVCYSIEDVSIQLIGQPLVLGYHYASLCKACRIANDDLHIIYASDEVCPDCDEILMQCEC